MYLIRTDTKILKLLAKEFRQYKNVNFIFFILVMNRCNLKLNTVSFIINLGNDIVIKLSKYVQNIYEKNYTTQVKEIRELK